MRSLVALGFALARRKIRSGRRDRPAVGAGEALYLRAHKQEKFLLNSVLGALFVAPSTYFLGKSFGAPGIVAGVLQVNVRIPGVISVNQVSIQSGAIRSDPAWLWIQSSPGGGNNRTPKARVALSTSPVWPQIMNDLPQPVTGWSQRLR